VALDVHAIRREFSCLERTGGRIRTDRIPTREDIHARWHWKMAGILDGEQARRNGVGRHGFLAGGVGKPVIKPDEPPLEWRFAYDPMPLGWFDHPAGRDILAPVDPRHLYLHHLAAKHLAGWADRPSGKDMYRYFTAGMADDGDRLMMRELLGDIRPENYPQLRRRDALSIWHIARAALDSRVRRGRLSSWLNGFALDPFKRPGDSPETSVRRMPPDSPAMGT